MAREEVCFVTVRQCSSPIEQYLPCVLSSITTSLQNQNGAVAFMQENPPLIK